MVFEQYLSAFHAGDAVGGYARSFHRFLLARGHDSRVLALTIDPELRGEAATPQERPPHPDALRIYHFAIASPISELFLRLGGRRVLLYHNVTPPEFFAGISEPLRRLTATARDELRGLVAALRHFVADSQFNAGELRQLGAKDVFVFPVLLDEAAAAAVPSPSFAAPFRDGRRNLLFVGRVTPNKRIEDLIRMLALLKRQAAVSPRLIVAGNTAGLPRYHQALLALADRMGLDSRDLVFTGRLSDADLAAAYGLADVFVSLSEHEGFCLPLIESCRVGLPAVALAAGAVPETLGGAGMLLLRRDLPAAAALVERVLVDDGLRQKLRQAAQRRFAEYRREADPQKLLAYLEAL